MKWRRRSRPPERHSYRSATSGSTAAARRAGSSDANRPTSEISAAPATKYTPVRSRRPIEQVGHQTGAGSRQDYPHERTAHRNPHPLAHDQPDHGRSRGAEGDADADLLRPSRHVERERTVEANRREQHGQRRSVADEGDADAQRANPSGHLHGQRDRFGDRHVGIDAIHFADEIRQHGRRVARDTDTQS